MGLDEDFVICDHITEDFFVIKGGFMSYISTRLLSRRTVLGGAAMGVAALAAPAIVTRARAAADIIRILGVQTAALPDWTPFTEETGLTVEFTGIGADPGTYRREIMANGAGEQYDIFIMNGGLEDALGERYFLKLDESLVPDWQNVAEGVRNSNLLRAPDNQLFAVPAITNADSFAYYPEDFTEPEPLSWGLLFEDERTLGKVSLEGNWITTLTMAAVFLKVAKGAQIADPSNLTPQEANLVADYLIERKKAGQFRALWTSFEESVDLLGRREVIVSNVWEPAVKTLQADGKNVRYANAAEGYFKWMIAAYVAREVSDRGTEELAYRALGGFLGGAYAAHIAAERGYSTGRPAAGLDYAAANEMSSETVAVIEANTVKIDEKFQSDLVWTNIAPDHEQEIEAAWSRFQLA